MDVGEKKPWKLFYVFLESKGNVMKEKIWMKRRILTEKNRIPYLIVMVDGC